MDGFQVVKRRKQKRNPSVNILSIQHNTSRLVEEFNVERCKKKIIECRLGLQFNTNKSIKVPQSRYKVVPPIIVKYEA